MTSNMQTYGSGASISSGSTVANGSIAWPLNSVAVFAALAIGLLGSLQLFYGSFYSVHTDLAGAALSGRLAVTLGTEFSDYSLYFPPAERAWFTLSVWLSDLTGLRLDLAVMMLTGIAVLFSTGFAYHIRRVTVGATPLFLVGSVALLVILPILYKNVFGLREHMVVLGLWPYLVLRVSDPDNTRIGWKTRLLVGAWLGATLLLKYLYALVVLLVEAVDAALRRKPLGLFRIENLVSGGIVTAYLLVWLVFDPGQREAIAAVVSAIDANLTSTAVNIEQAAIRMALAVFFLLLAFAFKIPARITAIGLAMVVAGVIASWIQSRWYTHHLFPVTMAYIAWLWMARDHLKPLWQVAILVLLTRPIVGEFAGTAPYQISEQELDEAMADAGISVDGKRVGILNMHPSPFNQYLASHGAARWTPGMNTAYVASEYQSVDRPENEGMELPPIKLDDRGRRMLHDETMRLWQDMPPDVLILDESTSWPLRNIDIRWIEVFANDPRFSAILAEYRPVLHHQGEWLDFTVYVRAE